MAFDLSTAKPVKSGFNLATAKPVPRETQPLADPGVMGAVATEGV